MQLTQLGGALLEWMLEIARPFAVVDPGKEGRQGYASGLNRDFLKQITLIQFPPLFSRTSFAVAAIHRRANHGTESASLSYSQYTLTNCHSLIS